jgi:hypothetical protein
LADRSQYKGMAAPGVDVGATAGLARLIGGVSGAGASAKEGAQFGLRGDTSGA